MQILSVTGGAPLHGTVPIHGAKNSVLQILAAAVLCRSPCVLHNCPQIEDVDTALEILKCLGCRSERRGGSLFVDASAVDGCEIPENLAGRMRSSIVFLGPILARMGRARLALPGGCPLGVRPIDLHLMALRAMGAELCMEGGDVCAQARTLKPAVVALPFPSVGATENALLAATACAGCTEILNAAREPEIIDLAGFLRSAGAEISGAGSGHITVCGGTPLHGTTYTVLPDRIETATYLCAAAACGGEVTLRRASAETCLPLISLLRESGCTIDERHDVLRIRCAGRLKAPERVTTEPYPGFPTDAQAPLMAALLRAEGRTEFVETIFENRLRHTEQLQKMGADIRVDGRRAIVSGVERLTGAELLAEDLRGGAALVIAALSAEGKSSVAGVKHIKRGYDRLEENLKSLGADIKTVEIS